MAFTVRKLRKIPTKLRKLACFISFINEQGYTFHPCFYLSLKVFGRVLKNIFLFLHRPSTKQICWKSYCHSYRKRWTKDWNQNLSQKKNSLTKLFPLMMYVSFPKNPHLVLIKQSVQNDQFWLTCRKLGWRKFKFDLLISLQEVSQSLVSYWKKDELRSKVKKLKQKMDDLDKNRKAAMMTEVNKLLECSNCASVSSPQLKFLPYTCNIAVRSDSLHNKILIYYKYYMRLFKTNFFWHLKICEVKKSSY